MRLIFMPRAETDTGDSGHPCNGHPVGRKGPLIHDRIFSEKVFIAGHQRLARRMIFLQGPGRKIGLGRIYQPGIRRLLVIIHADLCLDFFYCRQIPNLL